MRKKGRALFIIHDVYQDFNLFPLGPGYLAACLIRKGHEVETYCMDVFHYTNEELAEFLEEREFDIIGLGFLAARYKETVRELCKVVNKHKKDAWFVLGGHGPSPIPEFILSDTKADIVSIGESEETIVELMECKLNNGNLSKVKGIAYRTDNDISINHRREPVKDLDLLPFPAWDIFPMEKYVNSVKMAGMDDDERGIAIISSRGCVNKCNFCYRMEDGIRIRSIEKVVEEMKILNEKYGATFFNFLDELFVLNKKRMKRFKELLEENNLRIKYTANCRVNIFDEEIAILLKETGCTLLNIGFESTSQKVLDYMKKNTIVEQNIRAAEIAKKVGLNIGLNFIWGQPGDTEESLRNNAEFIKAYNTYAQIRTIRPVTPYPGCDLYYDAIEKNLLKGPEDFFDKFSNSDLVTVNFTDIPEKQIYRLLYQVNKDLILDHFRHTSKDMDAAMEIIEGFSKLYSGKDIKFRGARKYGKEDIKHIKVTNE